MVHFTSSQRLRSLRGKKELRIQNFGSKPFGNKKQFIIEEHVKEQSHQKCEG